MDLNALKIFIKVVELKSFTRAARALGFTQSGVSRSIARLEQELQLALINRSTHAISLTPDGQFLYASSQELLKQLEDIALGLNGRTILPTGKLKITAPSAYGRIIVMPLLQDLLVSHPQLTIEAVMTDRLVDFIAEGFDAALRIGPIEDQQLTARLIKQLRLVTVASPEYLHLHGRPKTPADLINYNCLTVKAQKSGRQTEWQFLHDGEIEHVAVAGNLLVDIADVLVDAALCGTGIVQVMDFSVESWIAAGRLEEILSDFSGIQRPLSLVYSPSRHRSPKITALLQRLGINLSATIVDGAVH